MHVKKFIKNNIIYFADKIGLIKPTSDPFIIMYHRVIKKSSDDIILVQPGMYVTKSTFQMHIEYIKNNYNILPLNVLLDSYFSGKKMKQCCALTFDDGWNDNYSTAFEILKIHKTSASFFLATSFIGTNSRFWSEDVASFLRNSNETEIIYLFSKCNVPKNIKNIIINNNIWIGDKITEVVRLMKYIDNQARNNILRIMTENEDKVFKTMMDWDQINEMHRSGLCNFYPHSHSHELLPSMTEKEINEEISTSLRLINKNIHVNTSIDIFSYPSGETNNKVVSILKKHGFKYAVGTKYGIINRSNGRYEINRIRIHDDISNNMHMFKYKLK